MATAVICIIIGLICIMGIRSYVKKLSHGCCGGSSDTVKRQKPEDADISHYPFCYELEIDGMTCKNCAARIENAFNGTGDYYASINLGKRIGTIHAKEETPETELRRIVAKCGYSVKSVSDHTPSGRSGQ
ncbi:MAG: cation transporter [Lachnospiraceae bacterium]|nr:cation transporter [Lachnospiraceae bacterium]MCM1238549.1 cation transporter [Lachnospiraceae bacterium]MCM1302929.1 cation transporter [Butyrivibrio sp.]MCM1343001.1 cation transporter [Muribaculaceae bacterium]MCM1410731.1 cation transporter [Lachnospiraceae bacterium]